MLLKKITASYMQISPGKNNNFRFVYLLHILTETRVVPDFALLRKLVHFSQPLIQFLFVRPKLCRQLLSDSQSPATPLLLASGSYY